MLAGSPRSQEEGGTQSGRSNTYYHQPRCVWETGEQGRGLWSLGLWAGPASDVQGPLRSRNSESFWFLIKNDQEFQEGPSKALNPLGALSAGTFCA